MEIALPRMQVRQFKTDNVIFPDNEVIIILEGIVETKRHIFGERVPVPCNIYRAGCVLGFDDGDEGVTSNVETWSVCKGDVETIVMDKRDFKQLWNLHKKNSKFMLCQVIQKLPDFA